MCRRYRGQFTKLLEVIRREYLPALRAAGPGSRAPGGGDELIGALATLLESFIADGQYRKAPEGRDMPAFDLSSRPGNRA